ncbi:MAG: DUF3040 domain-containing protein [Acidimicrobiia bacterium]
MPLDDREQRILEEIERQFYQEDPKLAETVRNTTLATVSARNLKWAILGFIAGLGLMLGFFTSNSLVAVLGFVAMVVSVVWIVTIVKRRSGFGNRSSTDAWLGRLRQRWRRRR